MGNGIIDFVEDAMGTIEKISNVAQAAARRAPRTPRDLRGAASRTRTQEAQTQDQVRTSRAPRSSASPGRAPTARASEFSIVESIDGYTGEPEFLVRNQRGDCATCSSREFAQRVRDALG
jgi:hypothetical protein